MAYVRIIIVLLFQGMIEPREAGDGTYIRPRYLWDKLQFGTRWHVYVQVTAYDLLHSSVYREISNGVTRKTLLDVIINFPVILMERHPCRRGILVLFGRQFGGNFFVHHTNVSVHFLLADFRICGEYNITFKPSHYIDESRIGLSDKSLLYPGEKPLVTSWNLQAGEGFGINGTLSEFTAPRSHGCADARVVINLLHREKPNFFIMCPNWGKHSFVSVRILVSYLLHYYQKPFFIDKLDQHYTKLSLYYHILDLRNVTVTSYMNPMVPTRQHVKMGMKYTLKLDHFNNTFLNWSNASLVYMGHFPYALVYAFTLYLEDFLTPVISRQNVTCNIPEAEAIFYDGPVQMFWQPALPVLKYWSCSQISNHSMADHDDDKVRGSIGELNVILFVPKNEKRETSNFAITWHAQPMLPEVLRIREVVLDLSNITTIHFPPTPATFVDVVHVQAPKNKSVHLGFAEINYVLSAELYFNRYFERCLDGFKIEDPLDYHVFGQICSNFSAENLLKHYQADGLTVGQKVILKKKQYGWLSTISAIIPASVHNCVGYVNIFPMTGTIFHTHRAPQAVVTFDTTKTTFKNGSFALYSDLRIIFRCLPQRCCKLQIVPFNELVVYELHLQNMLQYVCLKYSIASEDLTSPSRFILDFSSIGSKIEFRNTSSLYGLRIYSLNNRFHKLASPYTGVWDTEAYSAQIGLHSSILTHAAGFTVQVGKGRKMPVCTDERGTNLTDMFFDVNLLGPCANADLNVQEIHFVVIHKIYENRRCCRFDGYITTNYSVRGNFALHLH